MSRSRSFAAITIALVFLVIAGGCAATPSFKGQRRSTAGEDCAAAESATISCVPDQHVNGNRMIVLLPSDNHGPKPEILLLILKDNAQGQQSVTAAPDSPAEAWFVDANVSRENTAGTSLGDHLKFCTAFASLSPEKRAEQKGVARLVGVFTVRSEKIDPKNNLDIDVDLRGERSPGMIQGKFFLEQKFHPELIPGFILGAFGALLLIA